jgi:hypothetical protein
MSKALASFCIQDLARRRELGNGLGSFTDSVLGEFTRKHQTDSSLNLAAAKSRLFVVSGELSSLGRNALKDIVDEGVHDGHALFGDACIRMDLLEHLVNVRRVRLYALLVLFAASRGFLGRLGACSLLGGCLGHC